MTDRVKPEAAGFTGRFRFAGYALGFSIGGFFDGILLHQVLQWHHLLSALEGGRADDLRFQILADGLFHVVMYIVGGIGLWLLWRTRREFALPGADRLLASNALVGFGMWHIVDGVLSHWVLGIHRIKMDSSSPLLWDLLWFAVFGVAFVVWGWMLRPRGPGSRRRVAPVPAAVAALTILTGGLSLVPLADRSGAPTVVVFIPGTPPAQAMAATTSIGGRLIWSDRHDSVWAVDLPPDAGTFALYRAGAVIVSDTMLPIGCLNWFETKDLRV